MEALPDKCDINVVQTMYRFTLSKGGVAGFVCCPYWQARSRGLVRIENC